MNAWWLSVMFAGGWLSGFCAAMTIVSHKRAKAGRSL